MDYVLPELLWGETVAGLWGGTEQCVWKEKVLSFLLLGQEMLAFLSLLGWLGVDHLQL